MNHVAAASPSTTPQRVPSPNTGISSPKAAGSSSVGQSRTTPGSSPPSIGSPVTSRTYSRNAVGVYGCQPSDSQAPPGTEVSIVISASRNWLRTAWASISAWSMFSKLPPRLGSSMPSA